MQVQVSNKLVSLVIGDTTYHPCEGSKGRFCFAHSMGLGSVEFDETGENVVKRVSIPPHLVPELIEAAREWVKLCAETGSRYVVDDVCVD